MAKVLYLSYDGMTDPLGQSQVIPYLKGLAKLGHSIDIVSFEKPEKFIKGSEQIRTLLASCNIGWYPQTYHKRPPVLSTVFDLWQMRSTAISLHRKNGYQVAHARSYISAIAALGLKKKFGIGFVFDMRGFWADERVDGGLWPQSNPIFYSIYRYFKWMERKLLRNADQIVCLTENALKIMKGWSIPALETRTTVIPCCVDVDRFLVLSPEKHASLRSELDLPANAKVLIYLGSLGTWYLLKDMLRFFQALKLKDPSFIFCFFTPEPKELILEAGRDLGIAERDIRVMHLAHGQIPDALCLGHLAVSFIQPSFSKLSSSPTKIGEYLASGLPIAANAGVGDTELLFSSAEIGCLVTSLDESGMKMAAADILKKIGSGSDTRRAAARQFFSLDSGIDRYNSIYNSITGETY